MRRTPFGWAVHDWHDLAPWAHSWDAADPELVTYSDSGTAWSVAAATRVDRVPNRGTNSRLMARDSGYYGGVSTVLGAPNSNAPVPGCLWVPTSARFNNRPCWHSDFLATSAPLDNFHSMLIPNVTNQPADYIGLAQPWWAAILISHGGLTGPESGFVDGDPGMTTMASEPTVKIQTWNSVTAPVDAGATIDSGIAITAGKAMLIIWRVDGASSWLEVNRFTGGAMVTTRVTGSQGSAQPLNTMHSGWFQSNLTSAMGFASGVPVTADVDRVRAWGAGILTAAG